MHKFIILIIIFLALAASWFGYQYFYSQPSFPAPFSVQGVLEEQALQKQNAAEEPKEGTVKVPIFVYHSISPYYPKETKYQKAFDTTPQLLEAHLKYLQENNFTTISFDDLADYFDKQKPLPPKPVLLTFDDDWNNQYIYAFPLLKKYHDTATFFVYTHVIGYTHFLTWKELKEMQEAGINIGAHTKTHPYLIRIKDANVLKDEIAGSKKILEDHLQKSVTAFAYPFGHYNDAILEIVKDSGFRTARSTYKGVYHVRDDLLKLTSILVNNDMRAFTEILK